MRPRRRDPEPVGEWPRLAACSVEEGGTPGVGTRFQARRFNSLDAVVTSQVPLPSGTGLAAVLLGWGPFSCVLPGPWDILGRSPSGERRVRRDPRWSVSRRGFVA